MSNPFDIHVSINVPSINQFHSKTSELLLENKTLKSLGPIDRKFHGHGQNDGFVLYEYLIKQCSTFCKYTNIRVMKKMSKKIACQQ